MLRARVKTACEIAGLDPSRLQDAVKLGHLPCIPETRPGAARVFDVNQIIMLTIYSELVRDDFKSSKAGEIACAVYGELKVHENYAQHGITVSKPEVSRFFFPPSYYTPPVPASDCVVLYADQGETPIIANNDARKLHKRPFSDDTKFLDLPIDAYRERIERTLNYLDQNRVVGEDIEG